MHSQVLASLQEQQAAEAAAALKSLRETLEEQRLQEMQAMTGELRTVTAERDAAAARAAKLEETKAQADAGAAQSKEAAGLKQQLAEVTAYVQVLVDRFGHQPGFPAPPASCQVKAPAAGPAKVDVWGVRDQGAQPQYNFIQPAAAADAGVAGSSGRTRLGRSKALFENRNVRFVATDAAGQAALDKAAAAGMPVAGGAPLPPGWASAVPQQPTTPPAAAAPINTWGQPQAPQQPMGHVPRGSNRKWAWG